MRRVRNGGVQGASRASPGDAETSVGTDGEDRWWIELCATDQQNRTIFDRLVRQVRETGVMPFVGAGLSAPYQLPQWSALIHRLAPDQKSRAHVDRRLASGDYEGAAEYLLNLRGPARFQLVFVQEFNGPLDVSKKTAVDVLTELPNGPIITTNFDRVIEQVFKKAGLSLDVLAGDRREQTAEALQFRTNVLLKIHGDFADPQSRIFTKTSYDRAYRRWLRLLLANVARSPLLFLGCSLTTDRTVQVLKDLVRRRETLLRHYALLPAPGSDAELRARTQELSEGTNIDAIWYPAARHEFVEYLLARLSKAVPPEMQRRGIRQKRPRYQDIPDAPFELFGRNSSEIIPVIETNRIVVVQGDRGIGKTAFALHALRRFMDRDTFDALVWITAAGRKKQLLLSHVLDSVSRAIDYPFKPQTPPERKEALLRSELARRNVSCLLLLDNYETIADPEITAFLFDDGRLPPTLKVLITFTGQLGHPMVRGFPLEALPYEDAAMMFRDRLLRAGIPQEPDAELRQLYSIVGGNPLALEWVVGQMRGSHRRHLNRRAKAGVELPRILAALKRGKAPVLKRVFSRSWREIGAGPRTVLAGISLFVRPALEECLRATTDLRRKGFHNALEDLLGHYLAKRLHIHDGQESELTGRRYFVHPFTRDYVEGQRSVRAAAVMYRRAARYYLQYIPARGGTPEHEEPAGLRELNGERENILAVLQGCWSNGDHQLLVSIVLAMARWLFIESHWHDLEAWGVRAVSIAKKLKDWHGAARILNEVGRTYSYRSDFTHAHDAFREARQLAAKAPADRWALAYIDHHTGEALMREEGRLAEARPVLERSLEGFNAVKATRPIIGVTYRLGMHAFESGNLVTARALAERGVAACVRENWGRLEGFNRRLLGDVAFSELTPTAGRLNGSSATKGKRIKEARFELRRALELVPQSDMRIQALIELSQAKLESRFGDENAGREKAETAVTHFEKLGMSREANIARRLAAGVAD
jgi:tetratricopeptide (TPR) repeat protein